MEVVKSPKQKVHSNSSEAGTPKTPKSAKFEGNKFFGPNFSIEGLILFFSFELHFLFLHYGKVSFRLLIII